MSALDAKAGSTPVKTESKAGTAAPPASPKRPAEFLPAASPLPLLVLRDNVMRHHLRQQLSTFWQRRSVS